VAEEEDASGAGDEMGGRAGSGIAGSAFDRAFESLIGVSAMSEGSRREVDEDEVGETRMR